MYPYCYEPLTLRKYLDGVNIFDIIKGIYSFPFLEPAGATTTINQMLTVNYGQRRLFSGFKDITPEDAAKHIIAIYKDKWDALILAQADIGNISASQSKRTKGVETSTGNDSRDTETINKVSAFNSDDLLTDTGSTTTETGNKSGTVNNDVTEETFNLKTLFENLPYVEQTSIINVVIKDVSNYLTVSIY